VQGDGEQAIVGAANLGRDSDTITAMVGELVGALEGADVFPQAWAEKVLRLNPEPDLAQMAEDLCTLVRERTTTRQAQAMALLSD